MRGSFRLAALALLVGCGSEPPPPTAPPAIIEATPASTPAPAPSPTATPSGVRLAPASELPTGTRERAMSILTTVVDREAADPRNAWALAHGILARGPTFRASDGRLARDVLAADFLEPGPSFPIKKGAVRVEPHEDLILKSLIEAGVGLEEPIGAGSPKVAALLAASQSAFAPVRTESANSLFPDGNDAPWSVQAWCQAASAGAPDAWASSAGDVSLEQVAGSLFSLLERETHPLRAAAARGAPVSKNKQDIFRYTCGGSHLFQGVEACLAAGWPAADSAKPRFKTLADLYLYRVPGETGMVDAALQQYPHLAILLLNQDVKFLGHLLESLGKAERDGLWSPNPVQRRLLDQVEARLLQDVSQLDTIKAYGATEMAALAANEDTFQMYLDLVGDAAHALSGLNVQAGLKKD